MCNIQDDVLADRVGRVRQAVLVGSVDATESYAVDLFLKALLFWMMSIPVNT